VRATPPSLLADPLPPGGFYPVGLNLTGRACVVIGAAGDREAVEKVAALREAGAEVRWITDPGALRDDDLREVFFVISTPQDEALSARLRALADAHRFLLCTLDQPRYGFVAMQAIVRSGPVRIAISTGGVAPRVGKILKAALQRLLDAKFARFVECLAAEKLRNRTALPERRDRRNAIVAATEGFGIEARATYPAWYEEQLRAGVPDVAEPQG
jgi:precorrin-2 dehydrogenase/sirohydrochlorin ferrochelatase